MILGSCLCDKVRYQVDAFKGSAAYCHCGQCRKMHGSALGVYASVIDGGFIWLAGEEQVRAYRSSNHAKRTFCGHCGSTLQMIFTLQSGEVIDIALGTVDGDPGIRPENHIFVADKAVWHRITNNLPQAERWT